VKIELRYETSSSAVAKRPRDATCLSVVSIDGTNVEQSLLLLVRVYVGYKFITACN